MNTEMIIKYRNQVGAAAKKTGDAIIMSNLNLVRAVAAKYRRASHNLSMGDLVNEGVLGLIEARDRFDVDRGFEFSTYATYWVRRNILRALSETSRTISVPERIAIALPKLRRAIRDHVDTHGNEPDPMEVAQSLGLSKAIAKDVCAVINEPVSITAADGSAMDLMGDDEPVDHEVMRKIDNANLRQEILNTLTEREAAVIMGRFGLGDDEREYTLTELGSQLGLSREWVRQVELSALAKLKHVLRVP